MLFIRLHVGALKELIDMDRATLVLGAMGGLQ
jgi:hypothetical protein